MSAAIGKSTAFWAVDARSKIPQPPDERLPKATAREIVMSELRLVDRVTYMPAKAVREGEATN